MYPTIDFGLFQIGTFTICFGLGLVAVLALTLLQFRRFQLPAELQNFILPCIPIGLLVGVATAVVTETVLRGGWGALCDGRFLNGINFFGWLCGFIALLCTAAIITKRSPSFLMNFFLPSVAVAQGFGRIGCFLGGCCWGRPVASAFGIVFPLGSLPYEMYGSRPVFPVQLVESAWLFAVATLLFSVVRFDNRANWYFILVGGGRFMLEFMRGDPRGEIFAGCPVSPAQCIGLILVGVGVVRCFLTWRTNSRKAQVISEDRPH